MDEKQCQFTFDTLNAEHVRQVAKLHIEGINTGFISSLGIDFAMVLYKAFAGNKSSFGFVAQENGKILGFVAFTANLSQLYKSVILKNCHRFALLLAGKMFSLKRIKKMFETLFYPSRVKKMNLPCAELLSIVVTKEARGRRVATQLVKKGLQACRTRGIAKIKVLVGASNEPANKLYQKCGFELVGQINNHGVLSNIYSAQTDSVWPEVRV
jgi:ribosomal protein S18 acetylase RimI-like enzyme